MKKQGRPRLSDMEILVLVITEAIQEKRQMTGIARPGVRLRPDKILERLEKKLIQLKRLPRGYELTEHGKRHFTILLQQAARRTYTREPLLCIGAGSPKYRWIREPLRRPAAKMSAGR